MVTVAPRLAAVGAFRSQREDTALLRSDRSPVQLRLSQAPAPEFGRTNRPVRYRARAG
ncbi:MAG: hypothetical protein JWN52_7686 [Actinomycetia bacterium]|nr:hypothetical protein [Actinomycetes bacterium]